MEPAEKNNNDIPEKKNSKGIGMWIGLLVAGLAKTVGAWQMASILMTARPPAPASLWCQQSLDDNDSEVVVALDNCQPLGNTSCPHWEWQHDDSIIEEWNLVCDRSILVPVQQLSYLTGVISGGIICFFLTNRYGPKPIFLIAIVVQIFFGVLTSFVRTFIMSCLLRLLIAIACTNMFTCGMQLCSKVLGDRGPYWKIAVPACYEHFWSLGTLTLSLLGYFIPSWRLLQLCISVPAIVLLSLSWTIPDISMDPPPTEVEQKNEKPPPSLSLPVSITRIIAIHIVFACIIVNYYGGLLNSNNWGPHLYFNISIAGVCEILGVLLGVVIMFLQDFKWLALTILLLIGGLPMAFCSYLPDPYHPDMLVFGSVGRVAAACALTQISVQAGEFFPNNTMKKWTLFSATCFGRLLLLSAPFINYLAKFSKFIPMNILGSLLILASLNTGLLLLTTTKCSPKIKNKT